MRQWPARSPAAALDVLLGLAPLAPVGLATVKEGVTPEGTAGPKGLALSVPAGLATTGTFQRELMERHLQ